MSSERDRVVGQAIEDWYSANYSAGVRLTLGQRAALFDSIVYRLDFNKRPTEDVPAQGGS